MTDYSKITGANKVLNSRDAGLNLETIIVNEDGKQSRLGVREPHL